MISPYSERITAALNADGRRRGANGWYDPSNGSIHVDLYAGNDGKGTMLFTVAHELTHFIRQWSPAKFKVLANVLMKQYGQQGVPVNELVQSQIDKAKRSGREISYDTAYEEVIADSMEAMLADGSIIEMMAELKQQDKTLWVKIRDWFKDLAGKLKAVVDAYKGVEPDSVEGRLVADMQDVIGTLEALYMDALVDASENFDGGMQKNTTADGGGAKYSLRAFEDGTRFVDVQMDPNVFDGMTVAQMNQEAKKILMEKFAGRVIGIENRVFVNGDSVNEYLHPSKSIDLDTRKAKLTASGELDNLLDAGVALPNEPDGKDGHVHPDAIDFSYYKTVFKVGTEYFEGIVNIKNIKRGKLFKDVTKIRNITKDIVSSYGQNPKSNFLRDASTDSIRNDGDNVNKKFSDRDVAYTESDVQQMKSELSELTAKRQAAEEHYTALLNDADMVAVERRLEDMRNSGESWLAVVRSPEYKAARSERDAIKERLGIDAAKDAAYDLSEQERKLRASIHKAEEEIKSEAAKKTEAEAIAKSGLSEAEYFREQAAERFGYTQEFKYAGYLLPDGKMLDFTSTEGKKDGKRDKDHREISDIYEHTQQSAALLRFLNDGNIRVMAETPGIDLSATHEPTKQQYAEIKRFVREYADRRQFMVDISGEDGRTVGTYTYDGRVNADRVVSDIQYYFQNGKLRERSSVAQFLYSERDPDYQKVSKVLEQENKKLKEDVAELRELVKLQRSVTGGTKFTKTSVEAAARYLKQNANAKGDTKELMKLLMWRTSLRGGKMPEAAASRMPARSNMALP